MPESKIDIKISSSADTSGLDQAQASTARMKDQVNAARQGLRGLAYDIPGIGPLVERVFTPMGAVFTALSAAIGLVIRDFMAMKERITEAGEQLKKDGKEIDEWKKSVMARSEERGFLDQLKEISAETDRAVTQLRAMSALRLQLQLEQIDNDPNLGPAAKAAAKYSAIRSSRTTTESMATQMILEADQARIGTLQSLVNSRPAMEVEARRRVVADNIKAQFRQAAEVSSARNAPGVRNIAAFWPSAGTPTALIPDQFSFGTAAMAAVANSGATAPLPRSNIEAVMGQIKQAEVQLPEAQSAYQFHQRQAGDRAGLMGMQNQLDATRIGAQGAKEAAAMVSDALSLIAQALEPIKIMANLTASSVEKVNRRLSDQRTP